jgi:hypothetical protein
MPPMMIEMVIFYLLLAAGGIWLVNWIWKNKIQPKNEPNVEKLKEEFEYVKECLDNQIHEVEEKGKDVLDKKRKLKVVVGEIKEGVDKE